MKAVRIHEFGGADVLTVEEIERPVPAPDEVLVRVYASSVNPVDWVIRNGANEGIRSFLTLPMTLGCDGAGIVEEAGSDVTGFQKGDAVYGLANFFSNGTYAEYCAAKASQFALKPQRLSFTEAAAVPLAALTAWTGMYEYGKLESGQRILITGASGGVGSFAVQFARATGAYVIAVASARNQDFLNELGADAVIDYTTQPVDEWVQDVDVVLDASPLRDNKERVKLVNTLKEGGIFVSVNTDLPFTDEVLNALATRQATGELAANQPRREWLEQIARLIDAGEVKVFISKVFPLDEVAQAHRESERWHTRGKLVLDVVKADNEA
ncbi:NADP-dependent oxidoreductase [Spirosoma rhododendri]|uniref:NADP-dependent oxidoreductase n=1 Tax=Spirosoma rhododendri TaxID=2728024 RepID=A0A7L5DSD4_9BACT|nr:NADP-dependent oxidoreductase [Spirosoma rhododendri]QJD80163.1 NADP-dependent oxidoreductase [Spirosoma rhododendri]